MSMILTVIADVVFFSLIADVCRLLSLMPPRIADVGSYRWCRLGVADVGYNC
jgi:hypothetical protein